MARSASFVAAPCTYFEECGRSSYSKGMCLMHYKRVWRGGSAEKPQRIPNGKDAEYNLNFHGWTVTGDRCWEWNGPRFNSRPEFPDRVEYGIVYIGGAARLAHRVAYETWVGPINDGLFVCHSCDNRICIAPHHLWLGDNRDNMIDMVNKGRANRPLGIKVHNAVLDEGKVREIRERRSNGESLRQLASEYGVSESNVSSIARGGAWKWVN